MLLQAHLLFANSRILLSHVRSSRQSLLSCRRGKSSIVKEKSCSRQEKGKAWMKNIAFLILGHKVDARKWKMKILCSKIIYFNCTKTTAFMRRISSGRGWSRLSTTSYHLNLFAIFISRLLAVCFCLTFNYALLMLNSPRHLSLLCVPEVSVILFLF